MKLSTALLPLGLLAGAAQAQTCSLAQDIHAIGSPFSSNIQGATDGGSAYAKDSFVELGGYHYFVATSLFFGSELFRTDGTVGGTTLVADVNLGSGGSSISRLVAYNGKLWFSANDGTHGSELWTSDGTAAGTKMVADIRPGSSSSFIKQLVGMGGKVYFGASDGTNGAELWGSDGTEGGTALVFDVNPGSSGSNVDDIVLEPAGNRLLFRAFQSGVGTELWESDGTAAGTALLKDINAGPGSSSCDQFVHWNGEVYFRANDGVNGQELWKTDGTTAGTVLVADIHPTSHSQSPDLSYYAELGGELFFEARGANGSELWKTDGTSAGTVEVADIRTGVDSSSPADLLVYNGRLYFTAEDSTFGRELWSTDGTAGGTAILKDIQGGVTSAFLNTDNNFMLFGGELFFKASDGNTGSELWKTDGTSAGTVLVKDLELGLSGSSPDWLTPVSPTQLVFTATDSAIGRELFTTDGTSAGTGLLVDLDPNITTGDGAPSDLHPVGGSYFLFVANDGVTGQELYRWDKGVGATQLMDIQPGSFGSDIDEFYTCYLGGKLVTFFEADDGGTGKELWITDGTTLGTNLVKDINGSGHAYPGQFHYHPIHDVVFFSAADDGNGTELWKTDGTAAGTTMVADIDPAGSGGPWGIVAYGLDVFFRASDGVNGEELWKSDGTAVGTSLAVELTPGPAGSSISNLMVHDGALVFTGDTGFTGLELFVSDGTAGGTSLVVDLFASFGNADPAELTVFDGLLYFSATNGTNGRELFKTDLTAAGTTLVHDIVAGPLGSSPAKLTVSGDRLFFAASDGSTGTELWSTDGTSEGTHMAADINPAGSSNPDFLTPVSNGVYMRATGPNGAELHFSDGTLLGTFEVCDIFFAAVGSSPTDLILCDGDLFFMADDPYVGKELFTVAQPGAYTVDLGLAGQPIRLDATAPILGGSVTFSGSGTPTGGIGVLVMSAHTGIPNDLLVTGLSTSWIDITTASVQGVFTTETWSLTKPVPAIPSLVGGQLNFQSWILGAVAFPADTSNGLHLVLGN
ncbi:MAG: hypothetical protein P1V81_16145 [Planctomycetota bacterium]|nr:hypothetical protein [Planctomycetota bacterium]